METVIKLFGTVFLILLIFALLILLITMVGMTYGSIVSWIK